MFKPTEVLRGINDRSPKVIFDDLYTPTEIEVLQHKVFDCHRDIYKFKQYMQFKKDNKTKWIKLIKLNEGMIKELKIKIALLGG